MKKTPLLFVLALLFFSLETNAQTTDPIDRWDNWFLLGNKIVFGGENNWKHSHEIQFRVKENMQELEQWFYEGVLTYSPNQHWAIVPDFRAAVKPSGMDYRPGLGLLRVDFIGKAEDKHKIQLVQQVKYQFDIDSELNIRHGLRYVITYNKIVSKSFVWSFIFGPFYRWSETFTGIEFVRGGPSFAYIFNDVNSITFAPLFGAGNLGPDGWAYSFTPMLQVIFRANKKQKYLPAKYINF